MYDLGWLSGNCSCGFKDNSNRKILEFNNADLLREGRGEAAYDEQMRTYAKILAGVYPGRRVEALLVFTDRGAVRSVG